jgi:hypothetical protein
MEFLIALVLVAAVAAFVLVPLRSSATGMGRADRAAAELEAELADLEVRKQAKYREIRDTELDHAAGKLDAEDFARQDAELRADAIAILKRIDELERTRRRGRAADPPEPEAPTGSDPESSP